MFNVDEQTLADETMQQKLAKFVPNNQAIFICAKLEDELKSLAIKRSSELLESYGVKESGLTSLLMPLIKRLVYKAI